MSVLYVCMSKVCETFHRHIYILDIFEPPPHTTQHHHHRILKFFFVLQLKKTSIPDNTIYRWYATIYVLGSLNLEFRGWLVGWLVVFYYYYGATILSLFFFVKLCQFENEFKLTRWKKWFIHCHFFLFVCQCLLPYWWFFFDFDFDFLIASYYNQSINQ